MISLTVDSRIRVPKAVLDKGRIRDLCAPFEHSNPQHHKLKRMGYAAYKEPRIIETWDENDAEVSFPRGGMSRLREVIHSWGEKVRVVDCRTLGDRTVGVPPAHDLPLYDYQARCVEAALLAEQGIIRAPTGSGKTSFCLAFASRVGVPAIVVVNSNALLKQWVDRVRAEMGDEPGVIQGQRRQIRPLTVAMQQTLNGVDERAWKEINRVFGAVIADECHLFSAATFLRTIDRFRARYRIGASADETRRDGKQFLLYDVFGEVLQKVRQEDLIDREFVLDVVVQLEPTEFQWPFYRAHSDAFRDAADGVDVEIAARDAAGRFGVDAEQLEAAVRAGPPDFGELLERICADEARNKQVVELVADEVYAGRRVLVISHRVEHCRQLAAEFVKRRIACGLMLGGKEYEQEFASTKVRLRSGDVRVGVGTVQAVGTGIDVPELDRAVMVTPIMSRQLWGQVRGRICRTAAGKKEARIFYLWDRAVWGETTLAKMQAWNRVCVVRDGAALIGSREYRRRA